MKLLSSNGPNYLIRTQFSFRANDRLLNCILGRIADAGTSITGYTQLKQSNPNTVLLVVGPPELISVQDNRLVRRVLKALHVPYQEKKVLQILKTVPGTPGVLRSIFRALYRKVIVKAMYLGEETAIFVYTSNLRKTIRILKQNNII